MSCRSWPSGRQAVEHQQPAAGHGHVAQPVPRLVPPFRALRERHVDQQQLVEIDRGIPQGDLPLDLADLEVELRVGAGERVGLFLEPVQPARSAARSTCRGAAAAMACGQARVQPISSRMRSGDGWLPAWKSQSRRSVSCASAAVRSRVGGVVGSMYGATGSETWGQTRSLLPTSRIKSIQAGEKRAAEPRLETSEPLAVDINSATSHFVRRLPSPLLVGERLVLAEQLDQPLGLTAITVGVGWLRYSTREVPVHSAKSADCSGKAALSRAMIAATTCVAAVCPTGPASCGSRPRSERRSCLAVDSVELFVELFRWSAPADGRRAQHGRQGDARRQVHPTRIHRGVARMPFQWRFTPMLIDGHGGFPWPLISASPIWFCVSKLSPLLLPSVRGR